MLVQDTSRISHLFRCVTVRFLRLQLYLQTGRRVEEMQSHCRGRVRGSKHIGISIPCVLSFLAFLLVQQAAGAAIEEEDDYYDDYEPDEDEEEEVLTTVAPIKEMVTANPRTKRAEGDVEYYDFLANEYSYKLWAAFMIYDIICVFYGCLVSAYFAEVNTIAASPSYDYDYIVKRSASGVDESVIHAPPTHLEAF